MTAPSSIYIFLCGKREPEIIILYIRFSLSTTKNTGVVNQPPYVILNYLSLTFSRPNKSHKKFHDSSLTKKKFVSKHFICLVCFK